MDGWSQFLQGIIDSKNLICKKMKHGASFLAAFLVGMKSDKVSDHKDGSVLLLGQDLYFVTTNRQWNTLQHIT